MVSAPDLTPPGACCAGDRWIAARVSANNPAVSTSARFSLLFLALAALAIPGCERARSSDGAESPSPGADPKPAVDIETIQVSGHVYMLVGRGGNIGVSVGDDGILIVDDQFADISEPIRAALSKLSPGRLAYVLNTHHHGDHTGGNGVFGSEATIVSHENARKHMAGRGDPAGALPVITFDQGMSVHFNGEEVRLVHLPRGHTDGDSAVFFTKANVVHLGDNFFNGRLPFIDLDGGGDPSALLASTDKLLKTLPPDVKIIPGHGDLATMADYRRFRDMLADTIETVRKAKAAGKSLEEVTRAGFGGRYKAWAGSFVDEGKLAATIYKSL
jgi:glyoxylase-like metal-dependent hydrolase (beta-lactamase superfamily II)